MIASDCTVGEIALELLQFYHAVGPGIFIYVFNLKQ